MSADFWVGPTSDPDLIRLGPAAASGAEGVLYRGFHQGRSEALLAVKMLQPGHLDNLGDWTARWRQQAQLLRRVRVPGLVAVRGGFVGPLPHPRGQADQSTASLYLLMDWVEGVSLDRWVGTLESPQPETLLAALVPVGAALDLLHSGAATEGMPVIHRDVKPANILVATGGETILVDFGSVRGMTAAARRSALAGTPGYIAPEVRRHGRYSPASDRFSLGGVAFFLLTGSEPPSEPSGDELRQRLLAAPTVRGRVDIADHVLAMLNDDPARRPTALANWVAQLRSSSLPLGPGGGVIAPRAPSRHPNPITVRPETVQPEIGGRRRHASLALASVVILLAAVAYGLDQHTRRPEAAQSAGVAGRGAHVASFDPGANDPSSTITSVVTSTSVPAASTVSTTPAAPTATTSGAAGPSSTRPAPALTSGPLRQWDHIQIGGVIVQLGQELSPSALALLDGRGSTAQPYRYRDDPRVSIVVLGGEVALIMLATSREGYLDTPGLRSGITTTELRAIVPELREGTFGAAPALIASTTASGSAYFVLDYDDSVGPCPVTDRIAIIALLGRSVTPQLAPDYAYARCSSRA